MSRAKQGSRLGLGRAALVAGLIAPAALVGCGGRPDEPVGSLQPYARPTYTFLSETGLFADAAAQRLGSGVALYEPNFALWSDGADKRRWVALPPGGWIDSSDMNHWRLPIGARVWKEFSLDGVRLETRLIERYGSGKDDYWMGAFVWQEDQADALLVEDGERDVLGTPHDAPSTRECNSCHAGEPGRVLGFSALQLARPDEEVEVDGADVGPVTLERLVADGQLSAPPERGVHYGPPGDETTAAALGYLHANCGHCHNPWAAPWSITHMLLRLDVEDATVEDSGVFQSIVGQPLDHFQAPDFSQRVVPGAPEQSAILARMAARSSRMQMPPLATEEADSSGLDSVTRWVAKLHE
jgi:hypothetical protein